MMERDFMTIAEFYNNILAIKEEALAQQLMAATQEEFFKAGDLIFHAGDISNYIYFLEYGVIRGYMLDANGNDITDCFAYRCGEACMASFDRLELDIPSPYTLEVLEDSKFFRIPMETVIALQQKYIEVTLLYNQQLIASLEEHWGAKLALSQLSATERYQWFLQKYPDLIHRIRDKHIASFLRMTPVTLSRLRRTLREEQCAASAEE